MSLLASGLSDYEKPFGVLFLGRWGEIEGTGDYGFAIDNHDLNLLDRVDCIYHCGDLSTSR